MKMIAIVNEIEDIKHGTICFDQGCHKKRFLRKKQTNMYFIEKNTFFVFLCFFPPLGQWLIENRITAKYSSNSIRY